MAKSNPPVTKPQPPPTETRGRIAPSAPKPQGQEEVKKGYEKFGRVTPNPPKPNK